jgi:CRP/FNR family cyclic AMP-dependent transcriptional regulator
MNLTLPGQTGLDEFLQRARRTNFPAKTVVMQEGEAPNALFYIIKGSVTVLMNDEEGHEIILAYLGPGDFFGELCLFDDETRRSAWVRTRTGCDLATADYQTTMRLMDEVPELMRAIAAQLAKRLRDTSQKVGHLAFLDVTGRIARALLDLAADSQAITHPDGMLVRITREELGRLVNCSREVAGKVLRDLEGQGLIEVEGKSIVIFGTR